MTHDPREWTTRRRPANPERMRCAAGLGQAGHECPTAARVALGWCTAPIPILSCGANYATILRCSTQYCTVLYCTCLYVSVRVCTSLYMERREIFTSHPKRKQDDRSGKAPGLNEATASRAGRVDTSSASARRSGRRVWHVLRVSSAERAQHRSGSKVVAIATQRVAHRPTPSASLSLHVCVCQRQQKQDSEPGYLLEGAEESVHVWIDKVRVASRFFGLHILSVHCPEAVRLQTANWPRQALDLRSLVWRCGVTAGPPRCHRPAPALRFQARWDVSPDETRDQGEVSRLRPPCRTRTKRPTALRPCSNFASWAHNPPNTEPAFPEVCRFPV